GPLGEGLVVGDTVRCPWHHACFSLRTGEAVSAPALNPVACWEVERQDGRVRVARKRESTPQPPRAPVHSPSSVVVVGGGPAGAACAETLRRCGYLGPISLIAPEPPGPVDRPNLSKDYLAGSAPEEWIPLRDAAFYEAQRIELKAGDPVVRVEPNAHTLALESGHE